MYCNIKEKPSSNLTNGKIKKYFVKGYLQFHSYYAEKEYQKIESELGKNCADSYLNGWMYGKNKRYENELKKNSFLLLNRQIQADEPICIGNDEFTKYLGMNLNVMRNI